MAVFAGLASDEPIGLSSKLSDWALCKKALLYTNRSMSSLKYLPDRSNYSIHCWHLQRVPRKQEHKSTIRQPWTVQQHLICPRSKDLSEIFFINFRFLWNCNYFTLKSNRVRNNWNAGAVRIPTCREALQSARMDVLSFTEVTLHTYPSKAAPAPDPIPEFWRLAYLECYRTCILYHKLVLL